MNIAKDNTQTVEKLHNRYTTALNSQAKMNRATSSHPSNTGNHRASSHELHRCRFIRAYSTSEFILEYCLLTVTLGLFIFISLFFKLLKCHFTWSVYLSDESSFDGKWRLVEKSWPRSFPLKVSPQGGSSPSLRGARPIQYKKFANLVVFYSDFGHDFPQDKTCFFAD